MSNEPNRTKLAVIGRLLNGESPKDIPNREDASYATVLKWKRELAIAQANGDMETLMDVDMALLDEIMEGIKLNTPAPLYDIVSEGLTGIKETKTIAEALQEDLQMTAKSFNVRIRSLAMSTNSISDMDILTEILCKLQTAFFNKNSTQVNVQNNYGDGEESKYGAFLSDKPNDN